MIVDGTPYVRLAIVNPFLDRRYPEEGSVLAVLDTGYEGFVAVPGDAFQLLGFSEMRTHDSSIILPSGAVVRTQYAYGVVLLEDLRIEEEGAIETFEGLAEVVVGQGLLRRFRAVLDYCRGLVELEPCAWGC